MANENELLEENSVDFDDIDLEGLETTLNNDLASELSDLEYLKIEEAKIGNPDALGKVVLDEVWKQFGNQIGSYCQLLWIEKSVFFIRQPSFVHRPQKLYFWRQVQVV